MKTTDSKVQLDCEKHKTLVPTVRKYTHTEPDTPCERRATEERQTYTHTHTHSAHCTYCKRETERERGRVTGNRLLPPPHRHPRYWALFLDFYHRWLPVVSWCSLPLLFDVLLLSLWFFSRCLLAASPDVY